MTEHPIDLSSLHPTRDPERLERMRARILGRVEPSLAERRTPREPGPAASATTSRPYEPREAPRAPHAWWSGWMPPLLPSYLFSLAVLALSLAFLSAHPDASRGTSSRQTSAVALSLGLSPALASWVVSGRPPEGDALMRTLAIQGADHAR